MKRIKLGIKTSEHGNYTYNVYRSTRQQDLPDNVEVLNQLVPLMRVQEALLAKDASQVSEDILPDKTKAPRIMKTPYKISYPPLCSSIHNFVVSILNNGTGVRTNYDIEFLNSGVINTVNDAMDNTGDFEIIGENVYIAESLVFGDTSVSVSYYIKLINVSDDNDEVMEGIEYNGPVATGIGSPLLDRDNENYQVAVNSFIPIFHLIATGAEAGTIYYYRIVAEDTLGNISDPSPLFSIFLQQNTAQVKYKIEYTFDIGVVPDEQVVWHTLIQAASHGVDYQLGKPGTELFDQLGPIVNPEVPKFSVDSVLADASNVPSNSTLQLTVPNIWKENSATYNVRKTFAIRAIATDTHGNLSEVSAVIPGANVNVSMEQMICMKKEVSGAEDPEAPIAIDDVDAQVLKSWIKTNGRYFDPVTHAGYPTNLQLTNAPICLMTTASTFDTLIHVDDAAVTGKLYNYTFHIYDVYGNHTTVVKVVDTTTP